MFLTEEYNLGLKEFQFLSESEIDNLSKKEMSKEEYEEKMKSIDDEINKKANSSELKLKEKLTALVKRLAANVDKSNFFQYIKNAIVTVIDNFKKEVNRLKNSDDEQISIAVGLLILTSIINSLFMLIVIAVTGNMMAAMLVTAVACAPIVEETMRFIASKNNAGAQYSAAINIFETLSYGQQIISGMKPGATILAKIWQVVKFRIGPVLMHTINGLIQQASIEKNGKDNANTSLYTSILIHFAWNFGAVLQFILSNKR